MNYRKPHLLIVLFGSLLGAQTQGTKPPQQQPGFLGACANLLCEIENDWSRNNAVLYGLAGAMPEDKFNYKPTPAQQSFGERVLHAAQVNLLGHVNKRSGKW